MRHIQIIFTFFILINSSFAQDFQPSKGSLHTLNQAFHEDYDKLVKTTINNFGKENNPVMIFTGDSLILRFQHERKASRIIPMAYHQLKAIDHLPLAIFVMQSTWTDGAIAAENVKKIAAHKNITLQVAENLKNISFSPEILKQQQDIINASLNYLNTLLARKTYQKSERNNFVRSLSDLLLKNTDEAARLELTNLHTQVTQWKKDMDSVSFKNLYVVIGSSHQARYRETTVQYFGKVLNEKTGATALNENHLVFAESIYDEKGCLSVLARHIIDQEIGAEFFGDKFRMQRDLLSDAASKYIEQLFPLSPKK